MLQMSSVPFIKLLEVKDYKWLWLHTIDVRIVMIYNVM